MPTDALRSFLAGELDPDAFKRVGALLEPLYARAREPQYTLLPESALDPQELRQSLFTATGKKVMGIHFLSCARFGRPSSELSEPDELKGVNLRDNLCDTMRASLGNTLWVSLQASLRVSLLVNLQDGLMNSLGNGLQASLQGRLGPVLWRDLGRKLWNSMWDSLFCFLGFTLAGKKELTDRLEPLIRLFPRCLPVDERRDRPGIWIVLVA